MRQSPPASLDEKLNEGAPPEPGYDAWFRDKVERAMAEVKEPAASIPAEQIWRDLDLET